MTPTPAPARPLTRLLAWLPWIALLVLAAFPLLASGTSFEFYVGFVRRVLIYGLAAASLNLVLGQGGMVSLGHAAFVGAGAYVTGILMVEGVREALVAWPLAVAVAAVLALVIGSVALRTHGVVFIMITLAFAQMVYYLAVGLKAWGGDDGLTLPMRSTVAGVPLSETALYYVVLAAAALVAALLNRLAVSPFGHALAGVRENEIRMQAIGHATGRIKLTAFVLAGALAGLAGVLLANHNQFVSPALLHWTQSAELVVMVLAGGIGLRYGGWAGAALLLGLQEVLSLSTEYWHLPLGLILLAIVFWSPRGLAALFDRRPA